MKTRIRFLRGAGQTGFLVFLTFCLSSLGQTPPGDLTELSLEQILSLPIVRRPTADPGLGPAMKEIPRWSIGYRYIHANFSGHRDGTDSLSNAEILATAPLTSDKRFLILPTNIRQEAHVLELGYRASDRLSVTVLAPYIFQSTEHVSTIPGFADFTIESHGFGDVSVTPSWRAWGRGEHSLHLVGGLSVPFGSINETGDTPSPGVNNSLPYTMQIGSGTFDLLPGLAYKGGHERWSWSVQALATVRLGRNYRGYSLGNRYVLTGRLSRRVTDWFEPLIGLRAQSWERIDGSDPNLAVFAGPLYPASVADPRKYGGQKVNASVGVRFHITKGPLKGGTFEFQAGVPVYQRLHGPQPEEQWQLNGGWKLGF
ncbi:MAG: hypothetical protein ISQ14_08035 [Verrucomicrobiae bacterium]|jgi:hypothetical protein|nr:hypothetical protein [Verrucomicrobiae bacterium]